MLNSYYVFSVIILILLLYYPVNKLIFVLSVRRLDTGTVRVKSGQTVILTGVISDTDAEVISKWPILGNIPLISICSCFFNI